MLTDAYTNGSWAPGWGAGWVVPRVDVLAVDGAEGEVEPALRAREWFRQGVPSEEPDRARLQRVALELAAEHPAVEHHRVHGHPREAEAQPVEHCDQRYRFAFDARLLEHLLHRDLRRRVPNVRPTHGVEPP